MASATAMRPDAAALIAASGVRSPRLMASPAKPLKSASVTAQSATGTCQGPTIWSRWLRPPTVRSPMVIRKRLDATVGWLSTSITAFCRSTPVRSIGWNAARDGLHVAVHLGRLAQQHVHGHVHRSFLAFIDQHQLALLGGHADHRERAALALAEGLELLQRLGRDGQHVAFLALVAPDFLGRQAGLFQRHGAQVEARAAAGVVGQLGEGVGQAARAPRRGSPGSGWRRLRPSNG